MSAPKAHRAHAQNYYKALRRSGLKWCASGLHKKEQRAVHAKGLCEDCLCDVSLMSAIKYWAPDEVRERQAIAAAKAAERAAEMAMEALKAELKAVGKKTKKKKKGESESEDEAPPPPPKKQKPSPPPQEKKHVVITEGEIGKVEFAPGESGVRMVKLAELKDSPFLGEPLVLREGKVVEVERPDPGVRYADGPAVMRFRANGVIFEARYASSFLWESTQDLPTCLLDNAVRFRVWIEDT